MATIYLAELVVYDPALPGTRTLRYSSGVGFTTKPSETPADTYYDARIAQPVNIRRDLFAPGTTQGRSRVGYGDLVLINEDGALDALLTYGVDGRAITIRRGDAAAAYPGGFTTVFVGAMEQCEVTVRTVTVKVRDRQLELQVPVQPTKYAGNNALPAGLEGVATDLKGKPKPLCFGVVKNVPAVCVNTSKLIYQVNDGTVNSVDAVYDRGIALSVGSTYANSTDLLDDSLAPAAGTFKAYPGGGYFRLGSPPDSVITADVTQGANAAARTAAQMFTTMLTRAGKSSGDWSAADITALDTANPAVLGLWVSEETTCADLCDAIAGSVGAWWGSDRTGIYRIKRLVAPSGTSVATFTANDLLRAPERIAANDDGRGLPSYRTTIRYGRNYNPQDTDFSAPGIGQSPSTNATPTIPLGPVIYQAANNAIVTATCQSASAGPAQTIVPVPSPGGGVAYMAHITVDGFDAAGAHAFSDNVWVEQVTAGFTKGVKDQTTIKGTPPTRTYSLSGSNLQVTLGAHGHGGGTETYNITGDVRLQRVA